MEKYENIYENYNLVFSFISDTTSSKYLILVDLFKQSTSILIKHEIAYVFGQTSYEPALDFLLDISFDENEHEIVRHEAIEALSSLFLLNTQKYISDTKLCFKLFSLLRDSSKLVSESILLTLASFENLTESDSSNKKENSTESVIHTQNNTINTNENEIEGKKRAKLLNEFGRVDPVKTVRETLNPEVDINKLKEIIISNKVGLACKYEILVALRKRGLEGAKVLHYFLVRDFHLDFEKDFYKDKDIKNSGKLKYKTVEEGAVIKHEVCFVLGQLCYEESLPCLFYILKNSLEEDVVRHEAAISIGSIGCQVSDRNKIDIIMGKLKEILEENECSRLVEESIVIAMKQIENSLE